MDDLKVYYQKARHVPNWTKWRVDGGWGRWWVGGGGAREQDVSGLAGTQSRGAQLVPNSRYRRIAPPAQSHFAWTQAAGSAASSALGGGWAGQEAEDVGRREKFLFKPELKPGEMHGKEHNGRSEKNSREARRVARSGRAGRGGAD